MNGYELKNPIVEAFGLLNITGDIVPPEFYQSIKFDNGKPDLLAILILANVVYWYRPLKPRDDRTGRPLEWRQKFAGEKLQRTYEQWAEIYGATERQARDACNRLKTKSLLEITCKPNPLGGTFTFFEPVHDAIKSLLKAHSRLTFQRESESPTHVETLVGSRSNVSRNTPERESSIHEITTETTSDIPSAGADGAQISETTSDLPQDAQKTANPAQTARKAKKTARAKPDGEGGGTGEKPEPWTNPFCEAFSERFKNRWDGWEYKFSGRDFKAFKEIRATQGDLFTLPAFIRAATHYFQSPPKPKHAIWHLLDNFAVYYQGPLNRFNQLETENSYANQRSVTTGQQANGVAANGSGGHSRPLEFKSKRSI